MQSPKTLSLLLTVDTVSSFASGLSISSHVAGQLRDGISKEGCKKQSPSKKKSELKSELKYEHRS